MTDYTPVPGDSVKLVGKANTDNVLYGVIDTVFSDWWDFTIDKTDESIAPNKQDWTITPWTRPVTFKPFAVVRLPEGWNQIIDNEADFPESPTLVSRGYYSGEFWIWYPNDSLNELTDQSVATLLNHGAEILFAGVDTPGLDDA